MTKIDSKYTPVNCLLVDLIEIFATSGKNVRLTYSSNKMIVKKDVIFKTWITKEKEEFLVLTKGEYIRLDNIISINEYRDFSDPCSI